MPKSSVKSENFRRLATTRVNAATDMIRKIGSLFNKGNYEWTEAEEAAIFAELNAALRDCKKLAKARRGNIVTKFSFDAEE